MDSLLRDPEPLYQSAAEGKDLGSLCGRLLAIFVLTAAVYGAVMGAFRSVHPAFFFSDYELVPAEGPPMRGKVEGLSADKRTVYVAGTNLPALKQAKVRFNVTRPTDPYPVESVGQEQGFAAIRLAPGVVLEEPETWKLPLVVAVKTPLLFLLTLGVCAMALYALNLAFGLGLHFLPTMTLLVFGLAATGVMLGVFAPIALLFTVVTESYHFIKIMHVVVYAISGLFGVKVLYRGLARLSTTDADGMPGKVAAWVRARALVLAWLALYCVVGGQIAWTLKPFLGTPYLPATPPFRVESGNIYVSFFGSLDRISR